MKAVVLQEKLAKILNSSMRFVSARAQLPILENVVLEVSKTRLIVRATNLETSLVASMGAKVDKEGSLAVPARVVSDLVGNLGEEKVSLVAKNESLFLEAGGAKATVSGMNTSDFPVVFDELGKGAIDLETKTLFDGLDKVLFSVSRDDTRPVLTGVLFDFDTTTTSAELSMVSSDGFRLSQKKVKFANKTKLEPMILPRGILAEMQRLVDGEGRVRMEVKTAENQVVFGLGDMVLGSRVIEGEFPSFERIIPKETRVRVEVSRDELMGAVKLAAVFAREGSNMVKIVVEGESVKVLAESSRSGKQEAEIPAKVSGEGVEIAFNYRFLEEWLGVVEGESVEMEFTDGASPGVFRDPGDPGYLHLIMPVRVQE